jgi:hypothetical protein
MVFIGRVDVLSDVLCVLHFIENKPMKNSVQSTMSFRGYSTRRNRGVTTWARRAGPSSGHAAQESNTPIMTANLARSTA